MQLSRNRILTTCHPDDQLATGLKAKEKHYSICSDVMA